MNFFIFIAVITIITSASVIWISYKNDWPVKRILLYFITKFVLSFNPSVSWLIYFLISSLYIHFPYYDWSDLFFFDLVLEYLFPSYAMMDASDGANPSSNHTGESSNQGNNNYNNGESSNAGQPWNNNSSEEYNPSTLTRAYAERDKLDDEYHDCLQKCKDLCEILDKHNTGENPLDQDQCDNLKNDIKDAHQKTQQKLQERDIVSARIESGELSETDNDEETDSDE